MMISINHLIVYNGRERTCLVHQVINVNGTDGDDIEKVVDNLQVLIEL